MQNRTTARSRYDELHDRYHRILTTKAGTRYERLAALVFKALDDRHAVVHDLELAGEDPEVKHQIDVTIEEAGSIRRVLIECKDFDISGNKVGLDIIRNFRSVIEDTGADEGIVITCNGFTEDACKYARSKGIKLAVLRLFETRDMNGRIAKIIVGITLQQPSNPKASVFVTEEHHARYLQELAAIGVDSGMRNFDPVFFVLNGIRRQFNEFLTAKMNDAISIAPPKTIRVALPSDGWQIEINGGTPIPFDGIVIDFEVDQEKHTFDVVSDRVAELVLSDLQGTDLIIFGNQIERHKIDPDSGAVL